VNKFFREYPRPVQGLNTVLLRVSPNGNEPATNCPATTFRAVDWERATRQLEIRRTTTRGNPERACNPKSSSIAVLFSGPVLCCIETNERTEPVHGEQKEGGPHADRRHFRVLPVLVPGLHTADLADRRLSECVELGHSPREDHIFAHELLVCLFSPVDVLLYEQEFSRRIQESLSSFSGEPKKIQGKWICY